MKHWFINKEWYHHLLIFIIFLRPISDITGLHYIGIISPIIVLIVIILSYNENFTFNLIDKFFFIYLLLNIPASFFLILNHGIINGSSLALIITMYSTVYFSFRLLIKSEDDFDNLLKIILTSMTIPLLMIVWEMIFGAINSYVPGGRNLERYRGLYRNGKSYTIYWSISLIISAYLYLKTKKNIFNRELLALLAVIVIILYGLLYLSQYTAYLVTVFILSILIIFLLLKKRKSILIFLSIIFLISVLHYKDEFTKKIYPFFALDLKVLQEKAPVEYGGNSRIGIWKEHLNIFSEQNVVGKIFGCTCNNEINRDSFYNLPHNDFIRILLVSGSIGLLVYLLIHFTLFLSLKRLKYHDKFLLLSSLGTVFLISIPMTTTTLYAGMFFFPLVYAYCSHLSSNAKDKT